MRTLTLTILAMTFCSPVLAQSTKGGVDLLRVPHKGIQPQTVVDDQGQLHLIYFTGPAGAGDVYYVRSDSVGGEFSKPLRVNSVANSAVATGNIRGAQLAIGKKGRAHVAWFGSKSATPRGPGGETPMLYARLNDTGTAFEAERNLIQRAYGLDGGGSIAADSKGSVCIAWHAPTPGTKGEENRRVWLTRSEDEGKTFASEEPAFSEPTGACGCCGMRAFCDKSGRLYMLYRSARERVHRDSYLLIGKDDRNFGGINLQGWETSTCPMSSYAFAEGPMGIIASWETDDQVCWTRVDPKTGKTTEPISPPGAARGREHPAVAVNSRGETILVWTEGMGWNRGGALAWQVFDRDGRPTADRGRADGVPTWSLVAVVAGPDGRFTIVY